MKQFFCVNSRDLRATLYDFVSIRVYSRLESSQRFQRLCWPIRRWPKRTSSFGKYRSQFESLITRFADAACSRAPMAILSDF
jgi:hypothetical protein